MGTRVLVVFVPGHQATLPMLCPKTPLVMLAGALRGEGVAADCMDFGMLDRIARTTAKPGVSPPEDKLPGWMRLWRRQTDGSSSAGMIATTPYKTPHALVPEIGRAVLAVNPTLIAWHVGSRDEYRMTKAVSGFVRHHAPHIHQTLTGPYITAFGAYAIAGFAFADTGIVSNTVQALTALSETHDDTAAWRRIPGLIHREGAKLTCNPCAPPKTEACFTAYLPTTHEVASAGAQFAVYPLSFEHDALVTDKLHFDTPLHWQPPEMRVFSIIQALHERYGAVVFHIDAHDVGPATLERFADALLAHNAMAVYSLGRLSQPCESALADRLFASGCRAAGFCVPSGSQRLLEDFHGRTVSVSALRATLRCCRAAGMFTAVHLCYPCPGDDYHTRAETELFMEACRPDGVQIDPPTLCPDSLWFKRAPLYGFQLDYHAYQQWAAGEKAMPYRMQGWKNGRADTARRALAHATQQLGCMPGITEQHGLLARIARSTSDEQAFLETLTTAFERQDAPALQHLMAQVNGTCDMLQSGVISSHTAEAR